MSRYVERSPQARLDLIERYEWYADQSGDEELAQRFLDAAEATFGDLLEQPGMGRVWEFEHPDLAGIHKWNVRKPFGKVLVFYRPTPEGIHVVRVLHGRQNIEALFSRDAPMTE